MLIPHRFYIKLNKEYPYEYMEIKTQNWENLLQGVTL